MEFFFFNVCVVWFCVQSASDGEQIIKTDVPDKVDAIIWATGYGYVWPCIDKTADFYPKVFDKDNGGRGCNLDLGLMSPQYPTSLFFVGLQVHKIKTIEIWNNIFLKRVGPVAVLLHHCVERNQGIQLWYGGGAAMDK